MMHLIYTGKFVSREGHTWTIDLLRDLAAEPETVGTLRFPAEEALQIEWDEVERWEVIQGSSATLKILSPGDRTYADLYAIAVCEVRMDVYRDGYLFWTGTMDTEFYEEPYERAKDYEVTLTFSDLGVLERLKYNLTGDQSLGGIVSVAMQRAGLVNLPINQYYISLRTTDGLKFDLGSLSVTSENFYDEDGDPLSMEEVVDGILQPLSLRMVQRDGVMWIYDLYALQELGEQRQVYWTGDSQTMGTAAVVNNVKVTFSPYAKLTASADADGSPLVSTLKYLSPYDPSDNTYHLDSDTHDHYSYYHACDGENRLPEGKWDYDNLSFRMWRGTGEGLDLAYYGYFKIEPIFGGSEAEGVVYAFRAGTVYNNNEGSIKGAGNFFPGHSVTMRTHRFYLPPLEEKDADTYRLRIRLPILADGRYNPFTSDAEGNKEDRQDYLKRRVHSLYMAVNVNLYSSPESRTVQMHWSNRSAGTQGESMTNFEDTLGEWVDGEDGWNGTTHDGWLTYYDKEDLMSGSPIGKGWIVNRQCLGMPALLAENGVNGLKPSVKSRNDGQYLCYPACGGWLEIEVCCCPWPVNGWKDAAEYLGGSVTGYKEMKACCEKMAWLLLKAPEMDIVDRTLKGNSVEQGDIEYRGTLNPDAKEDVEIETICGTSAEVIPTARGCYKLGSKGTQLKQLNRGYLTDQPERILIGTIYGQAAGRKTTLSGEARIEVSRSGKPLLYTDANQPDGRLFMMQSETMDAQSDTTELLMVELSNVTYFPTN